MSKEIFVAFATQKGGIGKSTVTALAASYLHNVKGYNVAVVDCDDPQHSIHGLREHEMGLIDSSTYFKALACDHFRRIKKNAYTIVKSNAVNALDDAERMIATEDVKPDVVFLLIGINNTWRAFDRNDPTPSDVFRDEYERICQNILALESGPKLILLEPFILPSHPDYALYRTDLDPKIHVIRDLADKYADLYVPLDGLLNARALNGPGAEALAEDGVHPTQEGHETIADYLIQFLQNDAATDLL